MRHARNTLTLFAALGILTLAGCSDEPATAGDSASTPTVTPPPTSPTDDGGPREMAEHEGVLEPGVWAVPIWGDPEATGARAIVDIPAGYYSPGGWVIEAGDGGEGTGMSNLSFWYTDKVATDPCASKTTLTTIGPTARDLVDVLTSQPGNLFSQPKPVTVGGNDGYHLTFRLPQDLELAKCEGHFYVLWTAADFRFGGEDADADANALTHLWILDVEGQRVVISAVISPDAKPSQNAEILDMVDGVHFSQPTDS